MPKKQIDPSPWMKPISITPIIIACILGFGPSTGAAAIRDLSGGNIDCRVEVDRAIEEQKSDPLVDLRYSGPVEEKCAINNVIDEWP